VKVGTRRGTKRRKLMARQLSSECKMHFVNEGDKVIAYVEIGGKRIARRGPSERWVSIEPGYTVRGCEPGNYEQLEIEYSPINARPQ